MKSTIAPPEKPKEIDPASFQHATVASLETGRVCLVCESVEELEFFWSQIVSRPLTRGLVQQVEIHRQGYGEKLVEPAFAALRECVELMEGPLAGMATCRDALRKARNILNAKERIEKQ